MAKRVTAYRASKILYNFLLANKERLHKPFLLPVNICKDVSATFAAADVSVDYADIHPQTLCVDDQYVLARANDYSGILMVHTYGIERNFSSFYQKLRNHNPDILIVDDRCLCMPSLEPDTYGADLVIYSMGDKKQVNLHKGGIGYLAEGVVYRECDVTANSFLTNEKWVLDEIALIQEMQESIAHREALNAIYRNNLPKDIQLPEAYQHWRFNIMVENKERVLKSIFDSGLFASSHYANMRECVAGGGYYTHSLRLHKHIINLFNDSYFTEQQAIECCELINELL